jgi:hypothetical protein
VPRIFPEFDSWGGQVTFLVSDERITPAIFERHIRAAGEYVGLGRFRPENPICGTNGKFRVTEIKWQK